MGKERWAAAENENPGEAEGAYLTVLAGKHSDRSLISDWSCFTIF